MAFALSAGTGIVYGWMRYLCEPQDEFAVVNHPLQPDVQHAHIVAVPLLVFVCGVLWPGHVWPRLKTGYPTRRATGWLLAAGLAPMAVSGYLVQITTEPAWRAAWIWVHGISSVLWVVGYLAHQFSRAPNRCGTIGSTVASDAMLGRRTP